MLKKCSSKLSREHLKSERVAAGDQLRLIMTSRHEGVSCDACLKANFRGRRYKCLICYDYDLCAACYESGATTTRHTTEHPMQCILTRSDFDIFYGGEALTVDQPQSLTCPLCGKMGFTDTSLQEHIATDHPDTPYEVVCPICASVPGGDPNHVTDDFTAHLSIDHRHGAPRDLEEPSLSRHAVRRIPHQGRSIGRGVTRRNMTFGSMSSGLFSPSSREAMDPIAELLSQLSGVRRSAASDSSSTATASSSAATHLQQLQIQLERQQAAGLRQQLERLPRRVGAAVAGGDSANLTSSRVVGGPVASGSNGVAAGSGGGPAVMMISPGGVTSGQSGASVAPQTSQAVSPLSQFLLARLGDEDDNDTEKERSLNDRSSFVQELLLTTLCDAAQNLQLKAHQEGIVPEPSESPVMPEFKEPTPEMSDASTQTSPALQLPLTGQHLPALPPSHSKGQGPKSVKGTKVMVVGRPSTGIQPPPTLPSPQANLAMGMGMGRPLTGTGTVAVPPLGLGRGRSHPGGGGALSPGSTRRKMRGLDGRASEPPPH